MRKDFYMILIAIGAPGCRVRPRRDLHVGADFARETNGFVTAKRTHPAIALGVNPELDREGAVRRGGRFIGRVARPAAAIRSNYDKERYGPGRAGGFSLGL